MEHFAAEKHFLLINDSIVVIFVPEVYTSEPCQKPTKALVCQFVVTFQ